MGPTPPGDSVHRPDLMPHLAGETSFRLLLPAMVMPGAGGMSYNTIQVRGAGARAQAPVSCAQAPMAFYVRTTRYNWGCLHRDLDRLQWSIRS